MGQTAGFAAGSWIVRQAASAAAIGGVATIESAVAKSTRVSVALPGEPKE
jgi:hypothetical protein